MTNECNEPGCGKPVQARLMCPAHYAKWRRRRPGRCVYCGGSLEGKPAANSRTHDCCLRNRRQIWHAYTAKILDAYGPMCACCGETGRKFLTIDHVHGDGNLHRKAMGFGNRRLLLDIINKGFPPEFQILCYNCNLGRARNGGVCPHQEAEPATLPAARDLYDAVMTR